MSKRVGRPIKRADGVQAKDLPQVSMRVTQAVHDRFMRRWLRFPGTQGEYLAHLLTIDHKWRRRPGR